MDSKKSSVFLNAILLKDADSNEGSDSKDDSEKSDKSSDKSSDESEEEGGSITKWDKKLSSSYYTFSNNDRTCTYTYSSSSWYGTCVAKKSDKYGLKLGASATYIMMGFAEPSKLNKNISNYSNGGHYYYPSGSSLYGIGSVGSFQSGDCNQGTIYSFKYDKKKGEISIYKNGSIMGIAFKNIKKLKLQPVIDAYYGSSTYELVKPKFK